MKIAGTSGVNALIVRLLRFGTSSTFWLVLALQCIPAHKALPWGSEGHAIVAEIAQRQLTPEAARKVREILGGNVSLASVASWADDVRLLRAVTANWHFVDIPLDSSDYVPGRDCRDTPKGDCVIMAIERNKAKLADPAASSADRREALMFLVHFVGDVHQPLHTVKDFVGGNLLKVTFFTEPTKRKREKTNLHVVWDTHLIKSRFFDWGSYVTILVDTWLPGKNLDQLAQGTPTEWALAAHQIAIDIAFQNVEQDEELAQEYLDAARPSVDQQLALAGLRLGRILNETLK
jgi:hypothetical protein